MFFNTVFPDCYPEVSNRDQRIRSGKEEPCKELLGNQRIEPESRKLWPQGGQEGHPLASRMQTPCAAKADSNCLELATCLEDVTHKPSHWVTAEGHRVQGKKRMVYELSPKRAECGDSLRQTKCTPTRKELCFFSQSGKPKAGSTTDEKNVALGHF